MCRFFVFVRGIIKCLFNVIDDGYYPVDVDVNRKIITMAVIVVQIICVKNRNNHDKL